MPVFFIYLCLVVINAKIEDVYEVGGIAVKNTNLEEVKRVAKAFLYMDVEEFPDVPFFVQHPIFESAFQPIIDKSIDYTSLSSKENNAEFVNILEDEEGLEKVRLHISNRIDNEKSLLGIMIIIRKPYQLTFLRFIKEYLSEKDFGKYFAEAWVTSEDPNNDINVPIEMSIKWFRKCNKSFLMTRDELNYFNSLPGKLEVFRGVSIGRNPKGLSWTHNKEKAIWFAHRFDKLSKNGEKGYVLSTIVSKKDILAYFNRGEDEIVIDTLKLDKNSINKLCI